MQLPYISTRMPWDPTLGLIGLTFGPPLLYFGCSWALSAFCATATGGLLPGVVPAPADQVEALIGSVTSYTFFAGAVVWAISTPLIILSILFGANERRAVRNRELVEVNAVASSIFPLMVAVPEAIQCIFMGGAVI